MRAPSNRYVQGPGRTLLDLVARSSATIALDRDVHDSAQSTLSQVMKEIVEIRSNLDGEGLIPAWPSLGEQDSSRAWSVQDIHNLVQEGLK